jgi:uncharacterized MAPEG superfamily protein
MTVAYWCVLIALFLPYIATGAAKALGGGFAPKHNHDPRGQQTTLSGPAKRANNAQLNGFEVTPAFAAAVIIAHQIGHAAQTTIDLLAVWFVVSRVLYLICYLADWAPVRSAVWAVGMALIASFFFVSV